MTTNIELKKLLMVLTEEESWKKQQCKTAKKSK
jgi:hypothetical protein